MKLCVFDRSRGQEEGEEADKILFFFPSATPLQEQVVDEAQDGLSKQLRAAMGAARMDEPRGALGSPGMSAAGAGTSTTGAYGQSASASATWYRKGVRDGALREFLREAYHLFCLFYGPLPQLIRAIGVRTARRCLAAFLPDYLTDGLASTSLAATPSPFSSPYSLPSALTLSRAAAKRVPGLADNLKEAHTAQPVQRLDPHTMLHALSLLAQLGHSGTGMGSSEGPGAVGMVLYKDELVATTIPPVEAAAVFSYAKARLVPASTRPSGSASLFSFPSLQPRAPTPPRSASVFFSPRSASPSQPSRGPGASGSSRSSSVARQYSHRPMGPPVRTRERQGASSGGPSTSAAGTPSLHPPASLFPASSRPSHTPPPVQQQYSVSSSNADRGTEDPTPSSPDPSSPTSPHSVPFPPFPLTSPPRPLAQQCWTRDTDGFAVSSEAWGKDDAGLPVGPTVQMGWGASVGDATDGVLPGHERVGPGAGPESGALQSGAGGGQRSLGTSGADRGSAGAAGHKGGGRDSGGNASTGEREEGGASGEQPRGRAPGSAPPPPHPTTTMFLRACHSGNVTLVLCTPAGQPQDEGLLSPPGGHHQQQQQQQGHPQLQQSSGQQSLRHLAPTASLQRSSSDSSQRFWASLQELQKLLDAAYPGPLHTHVKGHRYLSVDTLASLSVASPAVKVGTLRRESLLLLNQLRWEVDHTLQRARVAASPQAVQQAAEKQRRRAAEAANVSARAKAAPAPAPFVPPSGPGVGGGGPGGPGGGPAAGAAGAAEGSERETEAGGARGGAGAGADVAREPEGAGPGAGAEDAGAGAASAPEGAGAGAGAAPGDRAGVAAAGTEGVEAATDSRSASGAAPSTASDALPDAVENSEPGTVPGTAQGTARGTAPGSEEAEEGTDRGWAWQGGDSHVGGNATASQDPAPGASESTGGNVQGAGLLHEMDGEERGCAGLLAGASEEVWEVYSRIGQSVWGAASSSWDGRKLYSIMERGADSLVGAQEAVEELQDRCSSMGL